MDIESFFGQQAGFSDHKFYSLLQLSHFLSLSLSHSPCYSLSLSLSLTHTHDNNLQEQLLPEDAKEGVRKRMRVSTFVCLIQAKFQQFLFFFMGRRMDEQEREFVVEAAFFHSNRRETGSRTPLVVL